jgi:hypothetical protein
MLHKILPVAQKSRSRAAAVEKGVEHEEQHLVSQRIQLQLSSKSCIPSTGTKPDSCEAPVGAEATHPSSHEVSSSNNHIVGSASGCFKK